uniref:PIF1/LRR1 pleckstrin homology domain-containing protein n=1 Tax=Meloidogyne javanica TaxID=6303 RepID=A0A915N6I4_MELJA
MSTLDCALRLENLSGKLVCRETRGVLVLCSHACGGKEEKRFLRIRMQNSSNNRQIELRKNCLTIWRSHIKQGKATIQFKEDNLMLYISMAKYEKLRSFLSQIENIDVNSLTNSPSKQQSTSSSFVDENRFRTKMSILKLKDYPKNDGAGFPKNLQQLYINNIKLQNVDIRWFSLRSLSILSLVDNNLGKNWTLKNWRRFCSISNLEQLRELDLSKNPLKIIPFYLLPRLTKLQISELPYLQFLPAQLLNRQILDEIDVTDNHLLAFSDEKLFYKNKLIVPKLVDLASAALLNIRQYWVDDGSRLLRNEILDFLPVNLRKEIRKCLLRCDLCLQ